MQFKACGYSDMLLLTPRVQDFVLGQINAMVLVIDGAATLWHSGSVQLLFITEALSSKFRIHIAKLLCDVKLIVWPGETLSCAVQVMLGKIIAYRKWVPYIHFSKAF